MPPSGYDEVHDLSGATRPHWEPFLRSIPDLQGVEFGRRWRDAQHLIRENGVTYNVYGDPNGLLRPWQLDALPVIIPQGEAEHLKRGLIQRATLLELILADLYGPQKLLLEGHLPPELIFPNPGFLRPCHGIVPPQRRFLHMYAANLGRSADGTCTSSGIARRHRPGPATHSRIGSSCRGRCRRRSKPAGCSGWRPSSKR